MGEIQSRKTRRPLSRRPAGPSTSTLPPSSTRTSGTSTVGMAQAARHHGAAVANGDVGDVRMASLRSGLAAHPLIELEFAVVALSALTMICPPSIAIPFSSATCWMSTSSDSIREAEVHRGKKALAARQHHRVGTALARATTASFQLLQRLDTGTAHVRGPLPA